MCEPYRSSLYSTAWAMAALLMVLSAHATARAAAWEAEVFETARSTRCVVSVAADVPALNPRVRGGAPSLVVRFYSFSPLRTEFFVRLQMPRKTEKTGLLYIGDKRFVLRLKDGLGWLWHDTNQGEVLDELRTVTSIRIRMIESNRVLEDRYSVSGFGAAVEQLKDICRVNA